MSDSQQTPRPTVQRSGLGFLLASAGVAITGQGMVTVAAPLMAASLTRNPILVSAVTAASYAAWLVIGLPAGALSDRWPRRRTMVTADLVRALVLGVFTVLVLTGQASIASLILAVFLVGVAGCFFDPASQAAIPALVGRDTGSLARANGKLWALDTFGRSLAGPPLGAGAFALMAALPFGLEAGAFAISAVLLLGIRGLDTSELSRREHEPIRAAVKAGVQFLWRHRQLRALALGMGAYNFSFNIAFAPLVLFAQAELGVQDIGFGLLVAAMAIGGILGGWVASRLSARISARNVYAVALAGQGVGWLLVWLSPTAWFAGIALALVGLSSTAVSVAGGAARQLLTPDDMLGRVTSGTRLVGIGSAGLGALLGGLVADLGGLHAPLLAASTVGVLTAVPFAARRS